MSSVCTQWPVGFDRVIPSILTHALAINKPKSISSAQALRDLSKAFNRSEFFAPWFDTEKKRNWHQKKVPKRLRKQQVKIGHGGTLDPMATGVLVVGLGMGTKELHNFLGCTKTYEATILFGAATDTYDTLGKVLSKAPYAHVTRQEVEKALEIFRGKIMQKPPLYSALHVQGKRLYEYAREGKEVPVDIAERPVEVKDIQVIDWFPGGSHGYRWPDQEAEKEDRVVAEKVLHLDEIPGTSTQANSAKVNDETSKGKRKRSPHEAAGSGPETVHDSAPAAKRHETDSMPLISGAIQNSGDVKPELIDFNKPRVRNDKATHEDTEPTDNGPPAAKLRMTVTSGFYVRSLAHDLGKAVSSLGCMSELVRTRQEEFEIGQNVLEMDDVEKGEDVWAPKLKTMLDDWSKR